jgi:hypothetical protein
VVLVLMEDKAGTTGGKTEAPGWVGGVNRVELLASLESRWLQAFFETNDQIRTHLRPHPGLVG